MSAESGTPARGLLGRLHDLYFQRATSYHLQWDSLDGVRGFAAFFVIFGHSSNRGAYPLPFLDFGGAGTYGIFLFFALSSFLLTYPLLSLSPAELRQPLRWVRYVLRRVLRIYPLYVVILLVSYAIRRSEFPLAIVWYPITSAEVLWQHLTLTHVVSLFWSIAVEFKYYMIMPAVVLTIVVVLRSRTPWVLAVGVASIALASVFDGPEALTPAERPLLQPYVACFLAGSLAAFVHWRIVQADGIESLRLQTLLEVVGVGCLLWVYVLFPASWSWLTGEEVSPRHFQPHRTFFGVLWAVFILCVLNGRGWLRRVFASKPLRFVGIVSFSTYLLHLPIHFALTFFWDAPPMLKAWVLLATALTAAAISFPLIERPFTQSRWVRRLTSSSPRVHSR